MTTMTPVPYRISRRHPETADTVSLTLEPTGARLAAALPGQFTMVYAFGVGEVPISVSGGDCGHIIHTVRSVGAVTAAICAAPVGATVGLRGPFGRGWPAPLPNRPVLVVAGGIGLAPLRSTLRAALATPGVQLTVLIGARTPADLIFTDEYDSWRAAGARVLVTVDQADVGWTGHVGVVTALLHPSTVAPLVQAYICGPEVMMRFTARGLIDRGVPGKAINLSLERNMSCGVGLCGHCQLGPVLVCRDGPVASFDHAEALLTAREL